MKQKPQTVILFGPPGCGKGTQGKILGSIPGFTHVSTGDIFRSLEIDSPLGETVFSYLSKGNLVPDELTLQVWESYMDQQISAGYFKPETDLLVLDGLPRSLEQAKLLEDKINILRVIYLKSTDPEGLMRRLKRRALVEHRTDDAKNEVIEHRWKVYRETSLKALEHYHNDKIAFVEADRPPASVLRQILGILIPVQFAQIAANDLKTGGV